MYPEWPVLRYHYSLILPLLSLTPTLLGLEALPIHNEIEDGYINRVLYPNHSVHNGHSPTQSEPQLSTPYTSRDEHHPGAQLLYSSITRFVRQRKHHRRLPPDHHLTRYSLKLRPSYLPSTPTRSPPTPLHRQRPPAPSTVPTKHLRRVGPSIRYASSQRYPGTGMVH